MDGWNWLVNARKYHYFRRDGLSLCGKWRHTHLGGRRRSLRPSEACKACTLALAKRAQICTSRQF